MPQQSQPEPGSGFEYALIGIGGTVMACGFATYLGARIAILTGGQVAGGLDVWLRATVRLARTRNPDHAWDTDMPSGWIYWPATLIAYLLVIGVVVGLVWAWRRLSGNGKGGRGGKRRRFGQEIEAREATPADVVPLKVDEVIPPTGRMLLGRMAEHRNQILATEDRNLHRLRGRAARRQGNRGSVALIGPTGSGKTAAAIAAIATWDGPVVAVSVKRDLYDTTAKVRADKGQIAVFDPGGATSLPTARWTPLRNVSTSSGALRTGRALSQAIPRSGVTNAEYWAKHGEKLLSAFMCVAGISRTLQNPEGRAKRIVSIEQLAGWVTAMATASDPTIHDLITQGCDKAQPLEVKLMARHASNTFTGVAKEDLKIRSSIYSTAVLALDPWLEPSVAHSASDSPRAHYWDETGFATRPRFIDLDWLMGGEPGKANTLYLTASQPEFERLSPVLGGLLADLKDSIHAHDIAGNRLAKPLLFVIDEAGQLELGWLPTEVSSIAALGAFFVTCWQSLSQIQHRYTTLADAVLSGHRSKCFFAGMDDLATVRYLTGMLGHEYVTRWTTSRDVPQLLAGGNHPHRMSVTEATQRDEFAPANALRQMYPGQAVLLHGTLPPIHVEGVRWWEEPQLRGLVKLDTEGRLCPPGDIATCPLSDAQAGDLLPVIDEETLKAALAQLPKRDKEPKPDPDADGDSGKSKGSTARPTSAPAAQGRLFEPPPKRNVDGTPVLNDEPAECDECRAQLAIGEGRVSGQGRNYRTICHPNCKVRVTMQRKAAVAPS